MSDVAIQVEDLYKDFRLATEARNTVKERWVRGRSRGKREFRALAGVNFEVPHGSTIGLIGHNGSGKSTLLKVLAGVYRPTKGAVYVRGKVSALLELGAGFHGELTGRENIYLNGAILGMSRAEVDANMEKIVDFAGIGEFIDSPVKVYSSGMYVRLGFAVAVTLDPEILIVDEIIAVGDEEFQRKCFDHLHKLRHKGCTIVLVTHSMALVQDLCDSAVWLDHGEVKALGEAKDVVAAYLNRVNEREMDRLGLAGTKGISKHIDAQRTGSGEVRIVGLESIGEDGNWIPFFTYGQRMCLRLHLEASTPMDQVSAGMLISHENGTQLMAQGSRHDEERYYDIPAGSSTIDFVLPDQPFLSGSYIVSVALHRESHTVDHVAQAFGFVVRSSGDCPSLGSFFVGGKWSDLVPSDA